MEREQALFLSKKIENLRSTEYEIKKLETVNGTLPKFHQWTNGKTTLAAFKVNKPSTETGCYLLFIDWHRKGIYYLVIYAYDKSTTLAELRQVQDIDGIPHIMWSYKPFKRDGKNDQRKAYFKQMFGSTSVQIPFPVSETDVDDFLTQLFKLCQNRIKADQIVNVFEL
ncbi:MULTISPECIES: hypothetical protein [Neobacillus]|uniref:Uncharacterized protein n=1 Tax=Neobacillus citreus TaxID=2833578 RepID=A0A942T7X3_9BACI|nr:hypothetical protein [Neobacillus citreus]MCH6265584.1 hypothetical protein [Neobacillus citreus]